MILPRRQVPRSNFRFARRLASLTVLLTASLLFVGPPATAADFKLTYSREGATGGTPPNSGSPYTIAAGATVVVQGSFSLYKSGLTFRGWTTEPGGGGTLFPQGSSFIMGPQDLTLYPAFGSNVFFSANGGTGSSSPSSVAFTENRAFSLPLQGTMQRSNYNFAGWLTPADPLKKYVEPGASYVIANATGPITLSAAWTRVLKFELPDEFGKDLPDVVWLAGDPGVDLPSVYELELVRRGFDLIGWEEFTGELVSTYGYIPFSAVTTLYPAWRAQPEKRTLKLDFLTGKSTLTATAKYRLSSLLETLSPNAMFPKEKIRIFIGSWRHSSEPLKLGTKRIKLLISKFDQAGVVYKVSSSNDARSAGKRSDPKNNRVELIAEWSN